ncbi:hypothetical protein L3V59_31940 [Burkholderia aenigmatica]|uniref:Uncharacterized protein n=1 Tax=Burkholderia aenigmatica TaxID=2015348 RepID=A0ABY6Y7A6_9BURK|nr:MULTISPECIES: hypothetical protein [Burkholderia]UKD14281.1 hypothetical protein L3V59_31940 [Burkholderia aenigmatica]VWD29345.1 hypothetical protein BLA17378_07203 [Burkholderia aenigmatica]VWD55929.1 hypothetical protein BLA18628_06599 [Burkholderia aenigmatica]
MSEITIDWPFYLVVLGTGIEYWPVTLCVGVAGWYFGATRLRGAWRAACLIIALLFIVDAGAGIYLSLG